MYLNYWTNWSGPRYMDTLCGMQYNGQRGLNLFCNNEFSEMCDYNFECFNGLNIIWCWPVLAGVSLVS